MSEDNSSGLHSQRGKRKRQAVAVIKEIKKIRGNKEPTAVTDSNLGTVIWNSMSAFMTIIPNSELIN